MDDIDKVIDEAKAGILPYESWERLSGETGAAYAAFCSYRDFGPERNIRRAVESFCTQETGDDTLAAKRYRVWRLWSMRFHWLKRAADYDQYLDQLKQAEIRKTIEERGEVHRKVADKMLQVVSKKLDVMDPAELTQGAVVEWLQSAIHTEHEILGVNPKETKTGIQFTPDFEGL